MEVVVIVCRRIVAVCSVSKKAQAGHNRSRGHYRNAPAPPLRCAVDDAGTLEQEWDGLAEINASACSVGAATGESAELDVDTPAIGAGDECLLDT